MKKTKILYGSIIIATVCALAGIISLAAYTLSIARQRDALQRTTAGIQVLLQDAQNSVEALTQEKQDISAEARKAHEGLKACLAFSAKLKNETAAAQTEAEKYRKYAQMQKRALRALSQKYEGVQDKAGKAERFQKKYDAAVRTFKAAHARAEKLEKELARERARFQYNEGVLYARAGLTHQAISALESALKFDAHNADAHYNLGVLYAGDVRTVELAIEHYRVYTVLRPQAPDRAVVQERMQGLLLQLAGGFADSE